MGTQQILLIVLSVIIVGAAIAVGIQMFNSQAYSANKSAIAADAQSFATQVVQFYKTPLSQGGAGQPATEAEAIAAMTAAKVGNYIGWGGATTGNESGNFTVIAAVKATAPLPSTDVAMVTIQGIGKEKKGENTPAISTTVGFPSCTIVAKTADNGTAPAVGSE